MIASAARIVLEMERYTINVHHWLGGYCKWYGITRRYDVPTSNREDEQLSHLIEPLLVKDDVAP
jgi:hypothetical protein